MTLSDLAIKRPVFAWTLFIGVILFGVISYFRIGVSMLPDVDFPVLDVNVVWGGAAPEVLETELVDKIEESVIGLEGLKEVKSTIQQGQATIKLEFDLKRNVDAALQDAQAAIARIRLPLNVDPPTIRKNNPEEQPIVWIAFGGERSLRDIIRYADLNIIDQLQTVPGVGEIQLSGFVGRNLRLWVDNKKLKKYQLTILDIVTAVEQEHSELAGGYMENDRNEINVRTMGEEFSAEKVADILISTRGGQPIYDTNIRLGDIARVEDGLDDIRGSAIISGMKGNGIALGIKKQRKTNEIEVADAVQKKVNELKKTLPPDLSIRVNVDFTGPTRVSIDKTQHELLMSVILTTIVCYVFLGTFKSAVNVILSIPFSVMGSFIIMYFLGFTFNMFTLLALALSIGIVVDDAIMMLENIVRHFQSGKKRRQAAFDGANEITFAAIAVTAAVIAIFIPVVFMKGVIGTFFYQFGVVISVTILLSLIEAITLTPMRCSRFMTDSDHESRMAKAGIRIFQKFANIYQTSLEWTLGHRWKVLLLGVAIFLSSLILLHFVKKEIVPMQDMGIVRMQFQTPVGSSFAFTQDIAKKVADYLEKDPNVDRFFMRVGGQTGTPNQVFAGIVLKNRSKRSLGHIAWMDKVRLDLVKNEHTKIRDLVRLQLSDLSQRGLTAGSSFPISFNIRGPDYTVLKEKLKVIEERLNATGLVTDLNDDYREGQTELRIIPNREAASLRGVSMDNLGRTINAAIGGIRQGKFTSDGRRYDVRIRLTPEERLKPEDVENIMIRTSYGELVRLTDVAKIETVKTIQTVSRINRLRSISVFGNVATGKSQSEALDAAERISQEVLPEGYSFHLEGGSQAFLDSFKSLTGVFLLGLAVAYLVLAVQFNSFVHPWSVMLAIPFSLTGAFLTLWMTGQSLNLFSMIGLLLLAGIVKKNSILLIEFTNHMRKEGVNLHDSLLKACPIRLRPIIMTSIATVGAAIPPALGLGDGAEARRPMALAVIGGVIVSTLLTLYIVPCAYSIFSRFERGHLNDLED
ncbi:MAG: efflux RND transporter permease subunit [Verrucomicrobiota bacterium]|nr:efflux RND transporter permease subunit [Verrucomicrobiota bacterium]